MTRAELLAIQRAEFNAGMEAARLLPHAPIARGKMAPVGRTGYKARK